MADQPIRQMDTFGPGDLSIPEVKLVQNVGGKEAKESGAKPGDFYCTITGETIPGKEGLDIIIVDVRKNRTYWGRTEIEDEPPICSSMDSFTSMNGEPCAQCPYDARCDTPWLLDATKRREKCLLNYNVMAIDSRKGIPIIIRASGISTQAVRDIMSALRLNREIKGEYHKVMVHLSSLTKDTASGEAFAMSLKMKGLVIDEKMVEDFKNQSLQILGTSVTILPDGVAAAQITDPRMPVHTEPSAQAELVPPSEEKIEALATEKSPKTEQKPAEQPAAVEKPASEKPKKAAAPPKKINTDF